MDLAATTLLNALTLISILALVGLGLTISFGLMNVTNLAHGEFVTIGAFTVYFVQSLGGKVTVRTGELIVAEHVRVAKGRSQTDPAHLQALWQQTVSRATAERHAPPPRCTVTFTQPVEQRPLSVYAEVAG